MGLAFYWRPVMGRGLEPAHKPRAETREGAQAGRSSQAEQAGSAEAPVTLSSVLCLQTVKNFLFQTAIQLFFHLIKFAF